MCFKVSFLSKSAEIINEESELIISMKVKLFDYEHELDLEEAINSFITDKKVIKIEYSTSHFQTLDMQIYSFSAMIIYE